MGVNKAIDITAKQRKTIFSLLQSYLPNTTVWAFGSRVKFTSRPDSDLDLAAFITPEQKGNLAALKEALGESDLPFRVDVLDWNSLPENFKRNIEKEYAVLCEATDEVEEKVGWKRYKLGEIAEVQTGPFGTQLHQDGWLFLGRCLRVRPKSNNLDSKYLSYFFGLEDFKNKIRGVAVGATMPSLNTSIMNEIDVFLPELDQQQLIASILSSLDDKIELNLQMNQTLETMAQSIFKEWFVNFNFPGFDGQLVDGLPKGWSKYILTDLLDTVSITHKFPKGKAIFLNTSDILEGEFLHKEYTDVSKLPGQAKKTIKKGDILFSKIRPANKRYAYVDFEADDYVVSTKLMVLRSKGIADSLVIYFYLKSDEILNQLQTLAESRSGTFPQITYSELAKIDINIPNEKTLGQYTEIIQSLFSKIRINQNENQTLTQIRDSLLPKLMSGKQCLNHHS